jgi:uncharacterized protein YjbI with pentapeptide repeats
MKGVDSWNAWRRENPDVQLDRGGANLGGAYLEKADLREANLREATLSGVYLSEAELGR